MNGPIIDLGVGRRDLLISGEKIRPPRLNSDQAKLCLFFAKTGGNLQVRISIVELFRVRIMMLRHRYLLRHILYDRNDLTFQTQFS